jgi:hypothetical protein
MRQVTVRKRSEFGEIGQRAEGIVITQRSLYGRNSGV